MRKLVLLTILILWLTACWNNNKNQQSSKDQKVDKNQQSLINKDKDIKKLKDFETKDLKDDIKENELDSINNVNKTNYKNENLDLTGNENNSLPKKKLSDFNIYTFNSAKECLGLPISVQEKKTCISKVETNFLNKAVRISDCKKLSSKFYKKKCLDNMYYTIAINKNKLSYCSLIKNSQKKDVCIRNIRSYLENIEKEKEKTKLLEKQKQEENKKILSISSINNCDNLSWDKKMICIDKFVKQDKDLRYCDKLDDNFKIKCINNNWNSVLKYDLLQAVKTKDKIYCDKIWKKEWIQKCYKTIK